VSREAARPRIGQGFDAHRLVPGRPLWLGGIEIPHPRGLEGHSDGDALSHAIADALLGALGAGDLGAHFPSSDASLAGIASGRILARVAELVAEAGLAIAHVDSTVVAEAPRLAPHLAKMRAAIAGALGVAEERVSVKAKSSDGLGAIGRGEGISALAVALLVARDGTGPEG
jgi:2-C-methyl-D-erythritol 2,4-cyclodiphosphate synthase